MTADTQPSDHAITAHFPAADGLEAALAELAHNQLVDVDSVTSGTGDAFARELEDADADDGAASRIVSWLLSIGGEREQLHHLGEMARQGHHAVVINDVADEPDRDAIVSVLKRHGGEDIVYFGSWQTEDLSIDR